MDCFDPFVFSIGNFIDGQKVDVSQSDPGYLPEKKRNKYHREKNLSIAIVLLFSDSTHFYWNTTRWKPNYRLE